MSDRGIKHSISDCMQQKLLKRSGNNNNSTMCSRHIHTRIIYNARVLRERQPHFAKPLKGAQENNNTARSCERKQPLAQNTLLRCAHSEEKGAVQQVAGNKLDTIAKHIRNADNSRT